MSIFSKIITQMFCRWMQISLTHTHSCNAKSQSQTMTHKKTAFKNWCAISNRPYVKINVIPIVLLGTIISVSNCNKRTFTPKLAFQVFIFPPFFLFISHVVCTFMNEVCNVISASRNCKCKKQLPWLFYLSKITNVFKRKMYYNNNGLLFNALHVPELC